MTDTQPQEPIRVIVDLPLGYVLPTSLKALLADPEVVVLVRSLPPVKDPILTEVIVREFLLQNEIAKSSKQAQAFAKRVLLAIRHVHPNLFITLSRCGHSLEGCRCIYAGFEGDGKWLSYTEDLTQYWIIPPEELLAVTNEELARIRDYRTRERATSFLRHYRNIH